MTPKISTANSEAPYIIPLSKTKVDRQENIDSLSDNYKMVANFFVTLTTA